MLCYSRQHNPHTEIASVVYTYHTWQKEADQVKAMSLPNVWPTLARSMVYPINIIPCVSAQFSARGRLPPPQYCRCAVVRWESLRQNRMDLPKICPLVPGCHCDAITLGASSFEGRGADHVQKKRLAVKQTSR